MSAESSCKAFAPDTWALIAHPEICPHSQKQIEVLKDLNVPLKGIVRCDLKENQTAEACLNTPYFPMLCNTKSNKCYAGLRTTCAQLEDIANAE